MRAPRARPSKVSGGEVSFWLLLVNLTGRLTVKSNGNQQDHKVTANRHAQGHADKDAVEKDAHFQKHALEDTLFVQLLGSETSSQSLDFQGLLGEIVRWVGGSWTQKRRWLDAGTAGCRGPRDGCDDSSMVAVPAPDRCPDGLGHHPWALAILFGLAFGLSRSLGSREKAPGGAQDHLDDAPKEDADEGDSAWHRRVVGGPEAGEALVAERDEGSRQEVHKGCGKQDASAKVANAKEKGFGDAQDGKLGGEHGHGAGEARDGKDDEERANMERRVVLVGAGHVGVAGILAP